jgi:hypothetical protein
VLRRIFEPKRDEVTGERRRLYNKELYAVYSSRNIVPVIKSKRLRWAGHVARMGRKGAYRVWWGNLREGDKLKDRDIDGRIISRCMFERWDGGTWTESILFRTGMGGRLL